jgi:hypothetical protein
MSIPPPWGSDWKPSDTPMPPEARPPHLWKKGQSGNPNGRPKGAPNRRTLMSQALDDASVEVMQVVIDAAKGGDMQAANLVLSRIKPPLRPKAETVQFELTPNAPLTHQAQQVMAAIAAGDVDPDAGKVLLDCLNSYAGIKEVDELQGRIEALEQLAREAAISGAAPGAVMLMRN